ncbi:hypothetical protein GGS21DRAFT_119286 [Xylaria nigripes]|nr:hypothetical protein GGS21DRAFT_119286 [Xylaria nigripes]
MAGTRRGARASRATERNEDQSNRASLAERGPQGKVAHNSTQLGPAHEDEENEDIETDSTGLMATPQTSAASTAAFRTADLSRPVTRSTRKGYFDSILVDNSSIPSRAHERLRDVVTDNNEAAVRTSRLEDARDIQYAVIEIHEGDDDWDPEPPELPELNPRPVSHDDELEKGHPTVGGLRVPRRSDRLRAKNRAAREPSPSTALSIVPNPQNRIQKRRKRVLTQPSSVITPLRRSARLSKPLEVFHKYPELPTELQLLIWEAAVQPRLTYICNRSSALGHAHNFGIQNKIPSWFMTCQMSIYVAQRYYKKLFGQSRMLGHIPIALQPPMDHSLRAQDINPESDIVIYEPCHSGCRACYCAQQYRREDRAAVRKLAVQIDSQNLPPSSEPGWVTVSKAWPNLTTLFMMKPAVKGLDSSEKAMIRIKEGDHEVALRKLFEAWKKGAGKTQSLNTLEFVQVVEQEPGTKDIKSRYQSVEQRRTGLAEDIILG